MIIAHLRVSSQRCCIYARRIAGQIPRRLRMDPVHTDTCSHT